MPVYMVERELPGIQMDQLAAAQKATVETVVRNFSCMLITRLKPGENES